MWDQIINNARRTNFQTKIKNNLLSNKDIISRIILLRKYLGEKYKINTQQLDGIDLFLQTLSLYPKDTIHGTECIYHLTNAIKKVENMSGGKKLLNKIKSDKGMIDQLLITYLLSSIEMITSFEKSINRFDIDIEIKIGNTYLAGQVKKIDQKEKFINQAETNIIVNSILRKNKSKIRLKSIVGIVPKKTENEWLKIISPLQQSPCIKKYQFKNKEGSHDDIAFFHYESTEKNGETGLVGEGIKPLFRLSKMLIEIKERASSLPKNYASFFIGVVPYEIEKKFVFKQTWLDEYNIGIAVLFNYHSSPEGGLTFSRGDFSSQSKYKTISQTLNKLVPNVNTFY